jgi:hypothetical protein
VGHLLRTQLLTVASFAQRKLREAGEGRLGLLAERPHLLTLLLTKRVRVSGTPGVRQRFERRAPTEDIDPPSHDNLWGSCRFPLMYWRVDISTRRLCVQLRKSQRVPLSVVQRAGNCLKEKREPRIFVAGFLYYGDTSSWGRGRVIGPRLTTQFGLENAPTQNLFLRS